jgi:hypothetical protein
VGTTGPIGSGLPQFGLPRRFAIEECLSKNRGLTSNKTPICLIQKALISTHKQHLNGTANFPVCALTCLEIRYFTVGFSQSQLQSN